MVFNRVFTVLPRNDILIKAQIYLFAALRRKHDVEVSDDISSDSVPNTPTTNPGKTRFSFPRIIPSAPIKQEHVPERTLHNVAAETSGVKAKPEPAAPKAKDQKLNESQKKEPKYKQSVIYRYSVLNYFCYKKST